MNKHHLFEMIPDLMTIYKCYRKTRDEMVVEALLRNRNQQGEYLQKCSEYDHTISTPLG